MSKKNLYQGPPPYNGVVEDILKNNGLSGILESIKNNQGRGDDDDGDEGNPFEFLAQMQGNDDESKSLDSRGIIFINGEIGKDNMTKATKRLLTLHMDPNFTDDIQVIINSPGGYTDAGWSFVDMMSFCSNRIRTICVGEICSMATNIFIAGDHRIMAPNSQAMIHHFSWMSAGNYSDLVAQRKAEDMEHQREVEHLLQCSKYKTEEEIHKHLLLDQDNWLTPKEMKKHGLCDEIFSPRKVTSKGVEKRLAKKLKKQSHGSSK